MTNQNPKINFQHIAQSHDGSGQSIGITPTGTAYTWGPSNGLGQLGRPTDTKSSKKRQAHPVHYANEEESSIRALRGFVGGTSDAGHSAILDSEGRLWLTGCDRWQQLGLGSPSAGAAGYTWTALWQTSFTLNPYLGSLMRDLCGQGKDGIRDVALGGDHSIVLSSNQKTVIAFGKGSEGQLGLNSSHKPFVSSPAHAKELSVAKGDPTKIGAVCAIRHCSIALDEEGKVWKQVGKCLSYSKGFQEALQACRDRSKQEGLIQTSQKE